MGLILLCLASVGLNVSLFNDKLIHGITLLSLNLVNLIDEFINGIDLALSCLSRAQ